MRKSSKKLALGKETLRNLTDERLKNVAGYSDYACTFTSCYQDCSCATHVCNGCKGGEELQ